MTGMGADAFSEEDLTGVPQWLQNVDLKGTRLPHREQNKPVGREEVSLGFGATGVFSVILPKGWAVSIFFFAGRVVAAPLCDGVRTSLVIQTCKFLCPFAACPFPFSTRLAYKGENRLVLFTGIGNNG